MKKRILITGGAGFLGSHLCEKLYDKDSHILCMDNLSTGSRGNIEKLINKSHFEFIEKNIAEKIDIAADEIYNFASPASPQHYQTDPINTLKTNVIGSMNMLDLARQRNAKILQASTSEVYGDPEIHPQTEGYFGKVNPVGIRSCYDEGKRCAETLFSDYHRQYKLKVKIVRIFNTYGPRMALNDGRVVSNFVIQALKGDPITIYGNGQQTRSFCYVDDLIDGIVGMMNTSASTTGPVNIGNPEEISVITLAEMVLKLTASKSKIVFKELPMDDPKQRCPDITRATQELGWRPQVNLLDGLNRTIEYFKTTFFS